jgi:DNA-binding SARP family transcriptional activator/tetratricopeptide (TPR) repeat protein
MDFRILGPLEVREAGVRLPLGGAKQRALLAVLLLHANEVVSVEALIDALWEEPPTRATKAVQVYASRLRKALGGGMPTSRPPGYVLELEPGQLDLDRFRHLLEEAKRDSGRAAARLEEAFALWRGPSLAEFTSEPFARVERLRLEGLRLEALEVRIEAELALGRHAAVTGELEALVAAHPLRERLRGQLMLALYRGGRQAEALAAYRAGRDTLVGELGIEPGRQLQELEQAILRQDPALELAQDTVSAPQPAPVPEPTHTPEPESPPAEERKVVSVVYVALVGSTARSDLADPEDLRAALAPFHTATKREIESRGGTVEILVGESALGVFGAPSAHEDDPERAVRTALAIRGWFSQDSADLRVRVAVNTDLALVSLDPRPHGSAIAAGDVVSVAQRMQTAAPDNGVLVEEQTYRATHGVIDYRESAPLDVEGASPRIRVWEALDARSRSGVDVPRLPTTPLVGRQRELDLLRAALARVKEERAAQLVTLVGVPGIGKSRLVFELFGAVDQDLEPITWRQGRCLPYGDGVSFWALGEVVKAQAGIRESDSPQQAAQKLRASVVEVIAEAQDVPWVERQLRPLVGVGAEIASGGERSGEAFAAWRRFLEGLADLRPLVLVLEDLHWAGEGLLEFVDELADRIRDAPLLVLCTARPELLERRPGWGGGKANALTISLPPLSHDETGRLVASVLDETQLEAELHDALLAHAEGNPLYAEQFARVLAELGTLDELPETVHGIIAARLDGLAPSEKALLQDAAVVGKVFWLGALAAIGHTPHEQGKELLYGLERREFVQRARHSSVAGEAEYLFRHVLLRDVAYGQIPRASRGEKHLRAAGWIESLGRPEDHAEMLAHHYMSALEYSGTAGSPDTILAERGRLALRAAGDRALALASYAAAARFYDAALELWPDDDHERAELLVRAGRAGFFAYGTGAEQLEQGFAELRSRGDVDGAAEAAIELARVFWWRGERDAAYSYVDDAITLAAGRGGRAMARALVARAGYHMIASEYPEAIRLARQALPLAEAHRSDALRIRALDVLGSARGMSGDLRGLDDSRHAVALAREHNAFSLLIAAESNLRAAQFTLGQLDAAGRTLAAYRRDVDEYGSSTDRRWASGIVAYEAVLHGLWEQAARILDELIAEAERGVAHYQEPVWYGLRASMALGRGDLGSASTDSKKALHRARRTKDPQNLAPALALRGAVLVAHGAHEEASQLAKEVFRLGASLVGGLVSESPPATLIEFTWLLRDLGREQEVLPILKSARSTPWVQASRAVAQGDFARAVQLLASMGAGSVEAYTRLRVAEELVRCGHVHEAHDHLVTALGFFTKVGATRHLARTEELLAAST